MPRKRTNFCFFKIDFRAHLLNYELMDFKYLVKGPDPLRVDIFQVGKQISHVSHNKKLSAPGPLKAVVVPKVIIVPIKEIVGLDNAVKAITNKLVATETMIKLTDEDEVIVIYIFSDNNPLETKNFLDNYYSCWNNKRQFKVTTLTDSIAIVLDPKNISIEKFVVKSQSYRTATIL